MTAKASDREAAMKATCHRRVLERIVLLTLRLGAWVVVAMVGIPLIAVISVAVLAAARYAKDIGIPAVAVEVPMVLVGIAVGVRVLRKVRRLRELHTALRDDSGEP